MGAHNAESRLARLSSRNKWYLGGGRRILWAPEFPLFLDRPGFWDPCTFLEIPIAGLLTWTILDGEQPLELGAKRRTWRPDGLRSDFAGAGMEFREYKQVTPDDALVSEIHLRNHLSRPRKLDVVLWARIDAVDTGSPRFSHLRGDRKRVVGEYSTHDPHGNAEHALQLSWSLSEPRRSADCDSYAVQNSEPGGILPDWRLTPFYELFDERLPNTCLYEGGIENRPGGEPQRKSVFIGLHRRIRLRAGQTQRLSGTCRIAALALATARAEPVPDWRGHFSQAPEFCCSDPYFEKYFDYRWYGLRLNAVYHGDAPLRHPCVFEGVNPGWFRHAISYSAAVLPHDLRWLRDPALARGCVLNFLENQREDGFIPGGLLTTKPRRTVHTEHMYHADWGSAVRAIDEIHPGRAFLEQCYRPLSRYAAYFDRERDPERSGLYDVCNQTETGQEYMSRYLFVDPRADEWSPFRLKGVDATVYVHQIQRCLAWMAAELGRSEDSQAWQRRAARTAEATRTRMWDVAAEKFCDVDPRDGRRCPARALTDFYPFMTDIVTPEHLPAIRRHLLNPREFWTPWPAPSTAISDETGDAYGRWRGKRHVCPWNGRTWLMTNSHIAEALAHTALTLDPSLEAYAVTFITRMIQMLFIDRDLERPTSYEYYNPITGQPPLFRGVDDYMHSWIIDLIIKYVVGLRPSTDRSIVVQPLQFGLKRFSLSNCVVAGRTVEVIWDGKRLHARVGRRAKQVRGLRQLVFR
jgi:hypothetical protein